jgi:hypothetical protein
MISVWHPLNRTGMRGLLMNALGQAGEFYEPYHGHDVADMDVVLTVLKR